VSDSSWACGFDKKYGTVCYLLRKFKKSLELGGLGCTHGTPALSSSFDRGSEIWIFTVMRSFEVVSGGKRSKAPVHVAGK
jgi:hypothetical protein